jgi:small multidrug resistance pump
LITGTLTYVFLAIAIACEVIATSFMTPSDGFSRPLPAMVTVVGYAVSFYFLSLALRIFRPA